MAKNKKTKQRNQKSPKLTASGNSGLMGQPAFFSNRRWHAYLILIFSFLLYANTLQHDYTQDDAIVIYDNMYTTDGLAGIPGILTYDTFKGFFKREGKDKLVSGGRYRPLTLVLFAIEWQLTAKTVKDANGQPQKDANGKIVKEGNPFVGHLINILLFGLTGLMLYWLLLALMDGKGQESYALFVALGAALLFVAHPIHTEAVANIKGRDEIVSLLGSLGAAYLSIRAFREGLFKWQILAGLVFFLALMSKENAITFLAVVPLMYYFFTKAGNGKIVSLTVPFIAASVLFLIIRFSILGSFGEPSMELMNNPFIKLEGGRYVPLSFAEKSATIMYTIGKYLQLLVFPHPLTHDYYPRHVAIMSWGNWQVLLSLLAFLGLIGYGIRGLFRKDHLAFAVLFYLVTFSIVSNILFPIGTNMAERLLFMPSVGFCIAVAILLYRLAQRQTGGKALQSFKQLNTALIVLGAAALLFGGKTISRNMAWKDNFTLFKTDVKTSLNSAKLRNAMGGELTAQSLKVENENERRKMLQEAVGHLNEALQIHPGYKEPYLQLGNCHNYLKEYDKAIGYYNKVLQFNPGDENATKNIAITYRDAGRYWGQEKNDLKKSILNLQEARKRMPNDYETNRLLGIAYGISGQNLRAIEYFQKAVEIQPNNADAHWNMGSAFMHVGSNDKANLSFNRAEELQPGIRQQKQAAERQRMGGQ